MRVRLLAMPQVGLSALRMCVFAVDQRRSRHIGERSRQVTPSRPQMIATYALDDTDSGERVYDVYSRLVKDRIIFLGTPIDDQVANVIVAQLVFLSGEDPNKEISIYINSPGGQVCSGMVIYDTMQFLKCDIATYCVGLAA